MTIGHTLHVDYKQTSCAQARWMQAVPAGCGVPDEISDHVCPVTKDVQQALLALILRVLTTYAHGN